jgi:hypothetical protein
LHYNGKVASANAGNFIMENYIMLFKIFLTLSSAVLGISLANSSLRKYQIFNILMEFLGSGGLS